MKASVSDRFAALIGLLLVGAAGTWWLASSRLALDHARDPARAAVDALQALVIVRGIGIGFVTARLGATGPWPQAVRAGILIVLTGWPVVLLAWSASTVAIADVVLAEIILLVATVMLASVGKGLRVIARTELAEVFGTFAGVAFATAVWLVPFWRMPSS